MYNSDYHFFGMHVIWWALWFIVIIWIFAVPYEIPGQRYKRASALEILQKRFAAGIIGKEEYLASRKILRSN